MCSATRHKAGVDIHTLKGLYMLNHISKINFLLSPPMLKVLYSSKFCCRYQTSISCIKQKAFYIMCHTFIYKLFSIIFLYLRMLLLKLFLLTKCRCEENQNSSKYNIEHINREIFSMTCFKRVFSHCLQHVCETCTLC